MIGLANRQIGCHLVSHLASKSIANGGFKPSIHIGLFLVRTHVSRAAKKAITPQSPPVANQPNNELKVVTPTPPEAQNATDLIKAKETHNVAPSDQPNRLISRAVNLFPKFMRQYARRITQAPVSHITAFLVLHELTAIVPLFGLWAFFHYTGYTPLGIFPSWIIQNGVGFIHRMAERNDWQILLNAETGSMLILQGAAAYAVVKATMPLRLMFSVWGMPWFARWFVLPISLRVVSAVKWVRKRK